MGEVEGNVMRHSDGPFGSDLGETESRRLTPSIGLTHDSDSPTDSSNEDFLFHLYRGSELLQDNRVHEAKEELERALHLQPRDTKGQDLLAVVYFRLGLYPRAIQIYEQLRRRNNGDTALLLNLALCYLKTGQPQLARRDLEQLLGLNSTHARAWGYLGLACERLGDLQKAEQAFRQGGHHQMAKRIKSRRDSISAPPLAVESRPGPEVREVAGAAYQELDAGELSFALAEPTSERNMEDVAAQSWRPHEPGNLRADTRKPDTRDGPPVQAAAPQVPLQTLVNRRPTLIAPIGAPPAHELVDDIVAAFRIPSNQPPTFVVDDNGAPSLPVLSVRRPVVAVPSPFGPAKRHDPMPDLRGATLPPPAGPAIGPPQGGDAKPSSMPPPPARHRTPQAPIAITSAPPAPAEPPSDILRFPQQGVVIHRTGVALVRVTDGTSFAVRVESIRTQQSGMKMAPLERHLKGKPTGESFGGVTSPMALASGDGQLVLAPRPGRKLTACAVGSAMCFAREDLLLGFDGTLAFENGRLTIGEGEHIPVVQLRGDGSVLFEVVGEILTLPVRADRSLMVRREVVVGWFGLLVPRALAPNDAPCGQRGLVSFAGEGRVLVTNS